MYKCKDCGRIFENPKSIVLQTLEHFGTPCEETGYGCPFCEGNYEEAYPCNICGEYISEGNFCENCTDKVMGQFKKVMKMFFTDIEQKLIKEELSES